MFNFECADRSLKLKFNENIKRKKSFVWSEFEVSKEVYWISLKICIESDEKSSQKNEKDRDCSLWI